MKTKDFQEAAAKHIVASFCAGQRRILLADEVGLGKTIVARRVVEQYGAYDLAQGDDKFVVIYICSNINIANQNYHKLGISRKETLSISEGRLSMQHLHIYENAALSQKKQLIPMTPGTSFVLQAGGGTKDERALLCVLLRHMGCYAGFEAELSELLRFGIKPDSWNQTVNWWDAEKVQPCQASCARALPPKDYYAEMKAAYLAALSAHEHQELTALLAALRAAGDPDAVPRPRRRAAIKCLRRAFAQISLGLLHPDLVIMDEFQRFKDLITVSAPGEQSESDMLAQKFLRANSETKVLLLSATPYKPYTTLEELSDGEEDHHREFMRVMDFLIHEEAPNRQFKQVWSRYSGCLCELRHQDLSVLLASKSAAENELYRYISRTERRHTGILDTAKAKEMGPGTFTENDVRSYLEMQRLLNELGLGRFPIDYVKSAPWLLSFMHYDIKRKLVEKLKRGAWDQVAGLIRGSSTLLLRQDAVDAYQKLPNTNARLASLFGELFPAGAAAKGPEFLLWVPASLPYYGVDKSSVFAQNRGFSKILIFSGWEMVPRAIAGLTSYEAERLVYEELAQKVELTEEEKHYYAGFQAEEEAAEPDAEEPDETQGAADKRRTGRRLTKEAQALVLYPSRWLAAQYDPQEHRGKPLAEVEKAVAHGISAALKAVPTTGKTVVCSAKSVLALLDFLDEPAGKPPIDLPENAAPMLAQMAIAGPAVCALRVLSGHGTPEARAQAEACAAAFVRLFNRPESGNVLTALYGDKTAYYRAVFRYCAEGNLQAVLEEYLFASGVPAQEFAGLVSDAMISTTRVEYDSKRKFQRQFGQRKYRGNPALRTQFAVGYFDARMSEKTVVRSANIRNAFNSPFRPFVLASTSIGQEGLDFHLYCRKIMHWNLPANPVDLEQREGRINRYLCHAIRQNIAAHSTGTTWEECMAETRQRYGKNQSEMVPYWCLPDEYPFIYHIERIVPMYPFSRDRTRYDRLVAVLALYRLTLGQPRQEELLALIEESGLSEQECENLFFDLSPFDKEAIPARIHAS